MNDDSNSDAWFLHIMWDNRCWMARLCADYEAARYIANSYMGIPCTGKDLKDLYDIHLAALDNYETEEQQNDGIHLIEPGETEGCVEQCNFYVNLHRITRNNIEQTLNCKLIPNAYEQD